MHAVRVFFYGSYINLEVLRELDLFPQEVGVASLAGFDIHIGPLANLVRAKKATVYGINATATHAELERLYAHAKDVLGGVYLPEAVLTRTEAGRAVPALTYIAHATREAPADPAYVQRIVGPARELGFPAWYLDRLESFLP